MTKTIDLTNQAMRAPESAQDGARTIDLETAATASPAASAARTLTVEHLLYAIFVATALLIRFVGLGAEPLSPTESAAAWSAWLAINAQSVASAPAPQSALLYGVQSLLFWIAGGGDILARAIPALAGAALVLLPWFWRAWIGRTAALVVAVIFALDPWLMAFSRRSDSAILSIFLALLALTALWQWRVQPDPQRSLRWERTAAVAIALLMTSGPAAWSFLPVLIAFALIFGKMNIREAATSPSDGLFPAGHNELQESAVEKRSSPLAPRPSFQNAWRPQRSTWLWFGVTLALAATGFALRGEAVPALSASLTAWVSAVAGLEAANPLFWPFLRLLIDQPLLTIFGVLGMVLLWVRPPDHLCKASGHAEDGDLLTGRQRTVTFLTVWLAWGLLLWLLPGRPPEALPVAGIALAMAAATAIGRLLEQPWGDLTGLELFTLLVVQTVLVVAGSIWLAALADSIILNEQIWLTIGIIIALMIAVWIVFGIWAGWRSTAQVAVLFYAVLLGAWTLRSAWLLNHSSEFMQPDGFWRSHTSSEVRLLVQDVERLSSIRRGDPNQIDMKVVYDVSPDTVLGWHLREMRNLRFVRSIDAVQLDATRLPLIVAPTSRNDSLPLPDPYIGSKYDPVYTWHPSLLPAGGGDGLSAQQRWTEVQRPQLRWLLYRKVDSAPAVESVTLWAPR